MVMSRATWISLLQAAIDVGLCSDARFANSSAADHEAPESTTSSKDSFPQKTFIPKLNKAEFTSLYFSLLQITIVAYF